MLWHACTSYNYPTFSRWLPNTRICCSALPKPSKNELAETLRRGIPQLLSKPIKKKSVPGPFLTVIATSSEYVSRTGSSSRARRLQPTQLRSFYVALGAIELAEKCDVSVRMRLQLAMLTDRWLPLALHLHTLHEQLATDKASFRHQLRALESIHLRTCWYASTHAPTHAHTHTHAHACTHACTCMHTHAHMHTHDSKHKRTHAHE